MMSTRSSLSGLLAVALMGLAPGVAFGSIGISERATAPPQMVQSPRRKARPIGGAYAAPCHAGYPNGPGWGWRQVQRMARKRRNVARNKAQHRSARCGGAR